MPAKHSLFTENVIVDDVTNVLHAGPVYYGDRSQVYDEIVRASTNHISQPRHCQPVVKRATLVTHDPIKSLPPSPGYEGPRPTPRCPT